LIVRRCPKGGNHEVGSRVTAGVWPNELLWDRLDRKQVADIHHRLVAGELHQFSRVFTSLWGAVEVNAVQTK
jgi:hypothetical protein